MYKEEVVLCSQILNQHFGPIVEQVGMMLIRRGRSTIPYICKETKMARKNVRECLVVLIQHLLVSHSENMENGRIIVHYNFSIKNLLKRTRIGMYLALIEERFGKTGLEVAKLIALNGTLTLDQIRKSLEKETNSIDINLYEDTMLMMVKDRSLVAVRPENMLTVEDIKQKLELKEISTMTVPPTAKELENIRSRINEEIDIRTNSKIIVGTKRKITENGINNPAKRLKMGTNNSEDEELDPGCFFAIGVNKLDVLLRNTHLANYADRITNIGGVTVMKTLLGIAEPSLGSCKDHKTFTISTPQIIARIPKEVSIENMIILSNDDNDSESANGYYKSEKKRNIAVAESVFSFLEILSNDKSGMVIKTDGIGPGQFYVNFEKGIYAIRRQMINEFVRSHYDEKQLSKIGMMPPTTCREKLMELSLVGLVEVQEIHRSADRAPIRTLYLYTIDTNRQASAMLKLLYSFTLKLNQRLDYENLLKQKLIMKANRNDVVNDNSLLSEGDKDSLNELNSTLEKIGAALLRIDSVILVFRDSL
ncbi:hypothetical protein BB559_003347 [Furculomyces boomerangus]|uniref:DNA-directed RNA polymerase III subunit RPC3 n=2 Tax=Harpellales TaxID=61421 RepID=A0A2T9YLV7_9FUNG|nr:hypothetical protein BB559_003347 [Furculomyces boomerangus]PVZ96555.1 hypothetical protein BB558_007526 [Smittium angustum]